MSKNFTGTSGSIWPILIPAIITSGAIILQLNRLMLRESRLPLQSPRDYCQSEKQIRPDSIQCSYHPHLTYLLSLPSHSLSVIPTTDKMNEEKVGPGWARTHGCPETEALFPTGISNTGRKLSPATHPNGRALLHKLQKLRLGCARVPQHQQVDVTSASESIREPRHNRLVEDSESVGCPWTHHLPTSILQILGL